MYCGVPMVEPICVTEPPMELGRIGPSNDSDFVFDGSWGLASPQSTTSVSPYWPSMMLPGFRSRCSTPRLWA